MVSRAIFRSYSEEEEQLAHEGMEDDSMFMIKPTTTNSTSEIDKKAFINFLRGLAIFLMLWGHCIQYCCGRQFDFFQNTAFKIIYSFHMPLFMLISGYLFFFSAEKRELEELVEYKTKSLLYPILTCSILNLFLSTGIVSIIGGGGGIHHCLILYL